MSDQPLAPDGKETPSCGCPADGELPPIVETITIAAPPAAVTAMITDPGLLTQVWNETWADCRIGACEGAAVTGSAFRIESASRRERRHTIAGRFIQVAPGLLVMSWMSGHSRMLASTVTLRLEPAAQGGTELRVEQRGVLVESDWLSSRRLWRTILRVLRDGLPRRLLGGGPCQETLPHPPVG